MDPLLRAFIGIPILFVAVVVLYACDIHTKYKRKRRILVATYCAAANISPVSARAGGSFVASDAVIMGILANQIFFGYLNADKSVTGYQFPIASINGVDLVTSSIITTTGTQSGAVGRSLAGGMLFGPAGAIIGSAGARHTNSTSISTEGASILVIYVDDPQQPVHEITLGPKLAREWVGRLRALKNQIALAAPSAQLAPTLQSP